MIDEASRCWSFYNKTVAETAAMTCSESSSPLTTMTTELSQLFAGLSDFLLSKRSLAELWTFYMIATLIVTAFDQRPHRAGSENRQPSQGSSHDTKRSTQAPASIQRETGTPSYRFCLTIALLMNNVLYTHYPDAPDLISFRQKYSDDIVQLSSDPGKLKPIGAGLVGIYLGAFWIANAERRDSAAEPGCQRPRPNEFSQVLEQALQSSF